MERTKIQKLTDLGQSAWIDNISRYMITSGKLNEMIEKGLLGMTSNPTIFENSITKSNDYDDRINELSKDGKTTFEIYDDLTVADVQNALDIFMPIYKKTNGLDGYVSLEINPTLANNTKETIKEGMRLFKKVGRPNIMFKVPATEAGFPAIEAFLSQGININVTLIFSLEQYIKTANTYINGVGKFIEKGGNPKNLRSVASVFVSRIDTMIDKIIDDKVEKENDEHNLEKLKSLRGKASVANSKIIYKKYNAIFSSDRFSKLRDKGANIQRLLWGSTSTKDPAYSPTKYVDELIGKDTVNTIPENTFYAFLDNGNPKESILESINKAVLIIDDLKKIGINIDDVTNKLLENGVLAFINSFESLLKSIETKAKNI